MIKLTNIIKRFDTLPVLRGIDLTIAKGEVVSIVGPSGAGKTTLLQIMGTLDAPDAGQVIIDNTDVSTLNQRDLAAFRNRRIGFVFQFHQLLPEFTALENVMIPALIANKNTADARRSAEEMLQLLGLSDRAQHKPNQLSGGEKQRLAIARSLIKKCNIILFDEATSALDNGSQHYIKEAIDNIVKDHTVVIVAHRLSTIMDADIIHIVDEGKLVASGKHEELLKNNEIYKTLYETESLNS